MTTPIEFFFDFSSPYGYIAASRAGEIEQASGRELAFNPYLMGALFKSTGRQPLASHPLVWDYAKHDVARTARRFGIDFNLPEQFPVATASACRAFYWVRANEGDKAARALAMDLLRATSSTGAISPRPKPWPVSPRPAGATRQRCARRLPTRPTRMPFASAPTLRGRAASSARPTSSSTASPSGDRIASKT